MDAIAEQPAVAALAAPSGGDAAPDLAQATAVLTAAAARAARGWPRAPALALTGFAACSACAAANHPDVAAAALACLQTLLGAAPDTRLQPD